MYPQIYRRINAYEKFIFIFDEQEGLPFVKSERLLDFSSLSLLRFVKFVFMVEREAVPVSVQSMEVIVDILWYYTSSVRSR